MHMFLEQISLTNISPKRAISQDETIYPEPKKFLPERFMSGPDGFAAGKEPLDPRQFAFGFGRRFCVGINFAEAVVYTIVVSTLTTLNISKAVDKAGKEIEPSLEFEGPLIRCVADSETRRGSLTGTDWGYLF